MNVANSWQGLMRLHLASIGDSGLTHLDVEYVTPSGTLTVDNIAQKKTQNTMMIDIVSTLSYEEFDDINDCKTAFAMWNKLRDIYGGDENVRRAKEESEESKSRKPKRMI